MERGGVLLLYPVVHQHRRLTLRAVCLDLCQGYQFGGYSPTLRYSWAFRFYGTFTAPCMGRHLTTRTRITRPYSLSNCSISFKGDVGKRKWKSYFITSRCLSLIYLVSFWKESCTGKSPSLLPIEYRVLQPVCSFCNNQQMRVATGKTPMLLLLPDHGHR